MPSSTSLQRLGLVLLGLLWGLRECVALWRSRRGEAGHFETRWRR